MKIYLKNQITMLILLVIALGTIALRLLNIINEITLFIVIFVCSTVFLSIYILGQSKSDKLEERRIIELESRIKDKKTRNIIKIISLVIMASVFYFIFNSQINNYYIFIYVILHIILTFLFITPKKMVIDYNAIHYFPNWKVKWNELKGIKLDKNNGVLILKKANGKNIQVGKIKEENYESIESMVKKYGVEGQN